VGRTIEVLVDDVRKDDNVAVARSKWDAPDVDGNVFIENATGIKPGDKVTVTVTGSGEYDLFAVPGTVAATKTAEVALTH
jgi:ribosomal protein S12 methylthiotransferase